MSKSLLSLKSALNEDSALLPKVATGTSAMSGVDVQLIAEEQRARVADSLDLDSASKAEFPQANRWDYLLSVPDLNQIVALEPHTAKDSEISVLIAKKKHATVYLRDHFPVRTRVARWLWVTHGKVAFSRMDKARRQLDQNGIEFCGRTLRTFG